MYEKWKQEQMARDKLMKDVLKIRQEQINEKSKEFIYILFIYIHIFSIIYFHYEYYN